MDKISSEAIPTITTEKQKYNLELERRIYQEYNVDIDAFFYDEFGCNYIDDNDNIISLYDEFDEELGEYIKSRTIFLTLDNQEYIDVFIYRYQGKRESFKQYRQEYGDIVKSGYGFFGEFGGFSIVYSSYAVDMLYGDDFDRCLEYMKNKIPAFDNKKDENKFMDECMRKLSIEKNED